MSEIKVTVVHAGERAERDVTTGTKAWELFAETPEVIAARVSTASIAAVMSSSISASTCRAAASCCTSGWRSSRVPSFRTSDLSTSEPSSAGRKPSVGIEKINQMCKQFDRATLDAFFAVKRAFDPPGLLNPGKVIPTLQRCAEYGKMHVKKGLLPFPELERF